MSDADLLLERLRAVLRDPQAAVWSEGELTGALRQAYHDLLAASGEAWLINGLDGELNPTNFAPHYFALLLRGALGYALLGRAAERVDAFRFDPRHVASALAAARLLLEQFQRGLDGLGRLRVRRLQEAENPPYPPSGGQHQAGWRLE
ncbi:MAG: hypothetical protein ROW48_17135 [Bellilinea sp.]|jgi:hypothetical protein